MRLFIFCISCSIASTLFAQPSADDLLTVMDTELKREMAEFSKADLPPYFLSYRVNDIQSFLITTSFGSMVTNSIRHSRTLVTDSRVGNYNLDSSHPLDRSDSHDLPRDEMHGGGSVELPLDNKPEAIQLLMWQQTQGSYRSALALYKTIKNDPKKAEAKAADFSKEAAEVHIDPPLPDATAFFKKEDWVDRVKKYSALFLNNSDIIDGDASLNVTLERKYFLSSEGARIVQNRTHAYISVSASVRADDGDIIPLHLTYFAFEPGQLPPDETILQDIKVMTSKLIQLREAPLAEPYTGPAILYAHAAGVFFHEIFGHRVEGHRFKDEMDGQTFKAKLKEQVLPTSLSVLFDPTLTQFNGQSLNGSYKYDDEGVKGQKVSVVDKGVLKTFLMSRSPLETVLRSNGHGRAQSGMKPVSRQSNLLIKNDKVVSMKDLRKMLISACKKQKKPYGYLFAEVQGGFTTTQRFMPNAFNIFPTEVYRIYADGRPDQLVRGVDLIGTPLAMFAEIQAADDKVEVFTGFCGAESGSVPVTAISPSLYVKRIETQKKSTRETEKPILEKPHP